MDRLASATVSYPGSRPINDGVAPGAAWTRDRVGSTIALRPVPHQTSDRVRSTMALRPVLHQTRDRLGSAIALDAQSRRTPDRVRSAITPGPGSRLERIAGPQRRVFN
ncbi:hypothetical protein AMJ82_04055 [candidate division TA06 bacterium SM23_40]|uniref:Uncharacterized protein n=1 Tax=candidate division TA06 bacterium SM23_40 TaxID=1703774 RepID=A0A0S8GE63_UNCT6|nr:MAG: hypothetical protein AMJ82_04055 [candidate division TA06 bacterium SM23_40]